MCRLRNKEIDKILVARVRELYDYDSKLGKLVNRHNRHVLKGTSTGKYLKCGFRLHRKRYVVSYHQAVWAWHHGQFPSLELDHTNRKTRDNHIENLRCVTASENKHNMEYPWRPSSGGLPGVFRKTVKLLGITIRKKSYYSTDACHLFYILTITGRRFKYEYE